MKQNKFPHYFICRFCALERGGISSDESCTTHKGKCEYCGTEQTLFAWNDFDYPKNKELTRKARAERD